MPGCSETPYSGDIHVFFLFLRGLGVRSEGMLDLDNSKALKDNKDSRLKQNLNQIASRYGQEKHSICFRRPYLVSS
jgi:hypothetical protein